MGVYQFFAIGGHQTTAITEFHNFWTENAFMIGGGMSAVLFLMMNLGRASVGQRLSIAVLALLLWPLISMSILTFAMNTMEANAFAQPITRRDMALPIVGTEKRSGRGGPNFEAELRTGGFGSASTVRITEADFLRIGEVERSPYAYCATVTVETVKGASRIALAGAATLASERIAPCPPELIAKLTAEDKERKRMHVFMPNCDKINAEYAEVEAIQRKAGQPFHPLPRRKPPYCTLGPEYDVETGKPITSRDHFPRKSIDMPMDAPSGR